MRVLIPDLHPEGPAEVREGFQSFRPHSWGSVDFPADCLLSQTGQG
jgi:hypothetical protein